MSNSLQKCPLCGQNNQCAMAQAAENCWCHTVNISSKILEKLPLEQKSTVCLCPACASGHPPPSTSA